MSHPRRTVLGLGLRESKHEDPSWDASTIQKLVGAEMEKLDKLGFDAQTHFIDPQDPESLDTVKSMLKSQTPPYDAVTMGFGLRGTKELTPLFESLVNAVAQSSVPPPKLVFATGPTDVTAALLRAFPDMA